MKNLSVLKQFSLFRGLSDEALGEIAAISCFRKFAPNEVVVEQGAPSDALFLIVNGIVAVKKIVGSGKPHLLAYLVSGLSFGELGILENQPRSAMVSALSAVEVLQISRDDFVKILYRHASVAVELAKILGRHLIETSRRQSIGNRTIRLLLLIHFGQKNPTIGGGFATILAQKTEEPAIYVAYPSPKNLLRQAGIPKHSHIFSHPGGFDILAHQAENTEPTPAQNMLMLDRVMNEYSNIVVSLPPKIDDTITMMLDYAKQIILIYPSESALVGRVKKLRKKLHTLINAHNTSIFTIAEGFDGSEGQSSSSNSGVDFNFPPANGFPPFKNLAAGSSNFPPAALKVIESCIDRIERNNKISIFIPTTIDTNSLADTSAQVDKTMIFFGERFGGATCKEAQGVWRSKKAGMVEETVFMVHSYATQSDLNTYLNEVVDYVKALKKELSQESMALEVNQKLTLI